MNPLKKLRATIQHHLAIDELLARTRDLHAAEVFHDRIQDSPWFVHQRLSPGNYAADYGFLKTLYNVLSAMRPGNILEFGLGQSSKLVHQYAAHYHANAVTCENSDEWIEFFFRGETDGEGPFGGAPQDAVWEVAALGYPMKIRRLPLEKTTVHGVLTTSYKDVASVFAGQRFDFILVDGPYGEERFSRPEIIPLAESNLTGRFCILMDDTQRAGDRETFEEVQSVLRRRDVPFVASTNAFSKSHSLIVSPDLRFLTTT